MVYHSTWKLSLLKDALVLYSVHLNDLGNQVWDFNVYGCTSGRRKAWTYLQRLGTFWGKRSKLRTKTFQDLRQNYKNKHFAQLMPWLKSASLIQNMQKLLLITPAHDKCNSLWWSTDKSPVPPWFSLYPFLDARGAIETFKTMPPYPCRGHRTQERGKGESKQPYL